MRSHIRISKYIAAAVLLLLCGAAVFGSLQLLGNAPTPPKSEVPGNNEQALKKDISPVRAALKKASRSYRQDLFIMSTQNSGTANMQGDKKEKERAWSIAPLVEKSTPSPLAHDRNYGVMLKYRF